MTIIFGTAVGHQDKLHKYCVPGIQRSMGDEPYAHLALASDGHVPGVYQRILEAVRLMPSAECLVLLHDDLEIKDSRFAQKIRGVLEDPSIGIIGLVGTTNLTSMYWWEHGPTAWRGYAEDGRDGRTVVAGGFPGGDPCPVGGVDGMLFALSPRTIRDMSFRPDLYTGIHGYVEEACMQAHERGQRIVVTRIDAFHHTQGGYAGGQEAFEQANQVFKKRWGLP